jgi:phosphomannomutase
LLVIRSLAERHAFNDYDNQHHVRATLIEALKAQFPDYGLTYAIGGEISFDVFPHGWDKTYSLRHVEDENFEEIHFFGDKTHPGGNDYEIFEDPRTIGHTVKSPEDTIQMLNELFLNPKQ